jgi:hypothetical protein
VQAGSGADVIDHTTGQALAVDGSSLTAGRSVPLGEADGRNLSIRSTTSVTWALERGGTVVQELDPKTLSPVGPPLAFPGHSAAPVETEDGTSISRRARSRPLSAATGPVPRNPNLNCAQGI